VKKPEGDDEVHEMLVNNLTLFEVSTSPRYLRENILS
jgi:hypothetical protein